MRKLFVMAAALAAVMLLGASSAAAESGDKGSGKPCPPSSPVGQLLGLENPGAPNCGNGGGNGGGGGGGNTDTCKDGKDNDGDGLKDKKDPECTDPNDGVEDGSDNAPAGNCALADLVLLTEDAKLLCLYLGENAENADKAKDCPDAELALPISPVLGACLFLPPEGSGGLPPLPSGLPQGL